MAQVKGIYASGTESKKKKTTTTTKSQPAGTTPAPAKSQTVTPKPAKPATVNVPAQSTNTAKQEQQRDQQKKVGSSFVDHGHTGRGENIIYIPKISQKHRCHGTPQYLPYFVREFIFLS